MKILKAVSYFCVLLVMACEEQVSSISSIQPQSYLTIDNYAERKNDIIAMSEEELNEWEKKEGFRSQRTLMNEFYNELSLIKTQAEYDILLQKFKHVAIASDSSVSPIIRSSFLRSIVNEYGFFESDGYFHKVTSDKVFTVRVENRDELLSYSEGQPHAIPLFKFPTIYQWITPMSEQQILQV